LIILGVDPGSINCGYSIIEVQKRQIVAAGCGTIKAGNVLALNKKIELIYDEICNVIETYKPQHVAIESIFFGKNVRSAIILGHVRGVILLAASKFDLKLFEYSPREIKNSVVGNGNASKEQVKYMVSKILDMKVEPQTYDEADALAVALCHFNKYKLEF